MKNRILIDTDILSYYFKGEENVVNNINQYLKTYGLLEISLITFYEITSGLLAKNAYNQLRTFKEFVLDNRVLPLSENSCRISAELYASLRQKGEVIDDIDLLIAGIALDQNMDLATNNEKHFGRIQGLRIVNWVNES